MSVSLDALVAEAEYRVRRRYGKITEAKLERWYGGEVVDSMLFAASGFTTPVPIMGTPAALMGGEVVNKPWWEVAANKLRRDQRGGFASLSDLIAEATAGKAQDLPYSKTGVAQPAVAASASIWGVGPQPAAGAAGAAPPGGTVPTNVSTGALGQKDPAGGDTLHLTTWQGVATQQVGSVMLYDLLFHTTTAANPGTGSIAVTGLQTRYTGSSGTPEYAAGNFITNRVTVVLPATAHNITYTYADQDNNAGASSGAMVGRASAAVNTADLTAPNWAANMAAGDTGVRQLTAIQFSVSPASGQVEHQVGHPIAILPCPTINVFWVLDGINSAFNLVKVMNGACLTFMEFFRSAAAGAQTHSGNVKFVSG